MKPEIFLGVAGEVDAVWAGKEKKCGGGKVVRAASLMAMDAGNSSSEEVIVCEAAARHVRKRKERLSSRGKRGGWREEKREGVGGMSSDRESTEKPFTGALRERWEPRGYSELLLAAKAVPVVRSGTSCAADKSRKNLQQK